MSTPTDPHINYAEAKSRFRDDKHFEECAERNFFGSLSRRMAYRASTSATEAEVFFDRARFETGIAHIKALAASIR